VNTPDTTVPFGRRNQHPRDPHRFAADRAFESVDPLAMFR